MAQAIEWRQEGEPGFVSAAMYERAVDVAFRTRVSVQGLRNDATLSLLALANLDAAHGEWSPQHVRSARALAEHAAECFRLLEAELTYGGRHGD